MITFEQEKPKEVKIFKDGEEILKLNLISSSLTNKFNIITDFITNVSEYNRQEFDEWFHSFLLKYKNSSERYKILKENIPYIHKYVDQYIDNCDVDFSKFVDETKVKKNSIFFSVEEIKQIVKISSYLKIYSIISNTDDLKLNQRLHKKAYNELCSDIFEGEIVNKIFQIIKTKTFRYKLTDRYMWDYIKMIQGKSIDYYVIEIFNFIMNQILVLCQETRNPITYFIGVVDESVKWFLRSVYKGTIIYNDSVSTEDIQGVNINNLKTYSYNDTIGRLKGIAYEYIYEEIEKGSIYKFNVENENETITEFQRRISEIEFISPVCECVVFPVLSKITDISFNHFKTLSPEHSATLSVFTKYLLEKHFNDDYNILLELLEYYPLTKPSIATTYKIKDIDHFINTQNKIHDFYGFDTKVLPYNIIRHFIGKISRISFRNIVNGKELTGVPLSKIEYNMINFYFNYFSGNFDPKFELVKKELYSYF
ncbi:MAG: hypothetical protein K9L74_05620 [Candidatus Izimaplasma sp.]|nr:hypothetical protein [Candidatus Izimaplasma bacterium]